MSVLACDRNGCENIMCDRLSEKHGYICPECLEELVNFLFKQGGRFGNVHTFMATPKAFLENMDTTTIEDVRKKVDSIFPSTM